MHKKGIRPPNIDFFIYFPKEKMLFDKPLKEQVTTPKYTERRRRNSNAKKLEEEKNKIIPPIEDEEAGLIQYDERTNQENDQKGKEINGANVFQELPLDASCLELIDQAEMF